MMNGKLVVVKKREFNPASLCEADQKCLEKVVPPKLALDV